MILFIITQIICPKVRLLYFFGLPPFEIDKEKHIEDNFLIARNRKDKGETSSIKSNPLVKLGVLYFRAKP